MLIIRNGCVTNQNPWIPYAAEIAADFLRWPVEQVRAVFGDTVLIRHGLDGYEYGRPDPAPNSAEVRAKVTAILTSGRTGCSSPA